MMETILNLIWLGVTLAALWMWRFRWAASRRNPRHNLQQEAIAMLCLLALLFPVISLSDDLHPEIAVVDSASGKRQCLAVAGVAHHPNSGKIARVHSATALLPYLAGRMGFSLESIASAIQVHSPASSVELRVGRSPPAPLFRS
jgi:hypothetical protein